MPWLWILPGLRVGESINDLFLIDIFSDKNKQKQCYSTQNATTIKKFYIFRPPIKNHRMAV